MGAARLLMSLARDGRAPARFASVDIGSGTPQNAHACVLAIGAALACTFAIGGQSGSNAFAACGTIGVLALVPIYAAV